MRMELGRKADYSIRAVLYLARHWEEPERHKARDIAAEMGIPENYVPQVLAALVHAGVVDSEPGPEGGYRLASDPRELTLLSVVEAVDGPVRSEECVLRGGVCYWADRCAVHDTWAAAQEALRVNLGATNFRVLAEVEARLSRDG